MNLRITAAFGAAAVAIGAIAFTMRGSDASEEPIGFMRDDPEVIARGAVVYAENCADCHGAKLEGALNWRQRGADGLMPAPPHDASGHTWHHNSETLFKITKYGLAKLIGDEDYRSGMPAYEGVLSDEEIIEVLSYIRDSWPDEIKAGYDAREAGE